MGKTPGLIKKALYVFLTFCLFGSLLYPAPLKSVEAISDLSWTQAATYPPGDGNGSHALTYDSNEGKVILWGGDNEYTDLYIYTPGSDSWETRSPTPHPTARSEHAMAYDPINQRMVVFGGHSFPLADSVNDTWVYDFSSDSWIEAIPNGQPGSPPAQFGHRMVFDSQQGLFVMYGRGETWTYNTATNTWVQKNPLTHPGSDNFFALAYDSENHKTIYFRLAETWAYDLAQNAWENRSPAGSPSPDYSPMHSYMTYDSIHHWTFLHTTIPGSGKPPETWVYSYANNLWTKLSLNEQLIIPGCAPMVFDPPSGKVILSYGPTWLFQPPNNLASISVQSPVGGEIWPLLSLQTIAWTSVDFSGNVNIDLSRDSGGTWERLFDDIANDGSEPWIVSGTPATICRIRVSSVEDPSVQGASAADFAIHDPREILVTSPNGGEFLKLGTPINITWTSSGLTGEVKIEISRNRGKIWETLFPSSPNDGMEPWTISGSLSSGCQIKVSSVESSFIQDTSDANFDIWDFDSWEPLTAGYDGGSGVMTIAVKPGDSTIVVAGRGANGGGFTSIDGGKSWKADATALATADLWDFAFIPGTDTVLAGGEKLFRSVDNALTWQEYWNPPSGIRWVEVDPSDSTRIFLGCIGGGIYRSTDGGTSWTQTITGLDPENLIVNAIVIEPDRQNRIFAATGGLWYDTGGAGVFSSTDGGESWSAFNMGLGDLDVRCLAVTPGAANPHYLYAGTNEGPVYRYNLDTGSQWEAISAGYYGAKTIAIDPQNPAIIYTNFAPGGGPFRVYKSVNGGGSWVEASEGLGDAASVCVTVDPNQPSTLFIAVWDQAICRSIDGAAHWESSNAGFGVAFASATTPADDPNTIFALMGGPGTTTLGGPVIRSNDGGMNWTRTSTGLNAEGTGLYQDLNNTQTIYESEVFNNGLFRTTNGGESWEPYNDGLEDYLEQFQWPNWGIVCLVSTPTTPDLLYAGTSTGVFKCVGGVWKAFNNGLAPNQSPCNIDSLVIDRKNHVLYAGVRSAGVWRTDDANDNWEAVNDGFPDLTAEWIIKLAIDKDDPEILYAATWDGVFKATKTTDGGIHWLRIDESIPSHSGQFVALHPQNINIAYVGFFGTAGVYYTRDGGDIWQAMNEGIMSRRFHWMGVDPNNPGYLYVCNPRGLYRYISRSFTTLENVPLEITLQATDPDPENTLTYEVVSQPAHGNLIGTGPDLTYSPNLYWNGTDSFTFKEKVDSNIALVTIVVTPLNYPPTLGAIAVAPIEPAPINTPFTVTATFNDSDPEDTHTATWDWDDGSSSAGSVNEVGKFINGSHTYLQPGVYTLALTLSDGQATATATYQYLVAYDSNGGFVTGAGWINSPPGAYQPNPSFTGKANFGFEVKYKKGATVPSGKTEFQFRAGNLDFRSTSFEWLVIASRKAQFKGEGTINGTDSYRFFLSVIDGQYNGDKGPDKFRIKIWDRDTNKLVYDNMLNSPDDADPTTVIGGGNIVIHKP